MNHRLAVSVLVVPLSSLLGCGGGGPKRLPESCFQVAFESYKVAAEMASGNTVSADITVKNVSPMTWPSESDHKCHYTVTLSYHWLNQKGEPVIFDGLRTPLPGDLPPGESVLLKAAIEAPTKPGRYMLELTLVQQGAVWFPEKHFSARLVLPVLVIDGGNPTADAGVAASVPTPLHEAGQASKVQWSGKNEKLHGKLKNGKKPPVKVKPEDVVALKPDGGAPGETRSGSIEPLASNINFYCVGGSTLDR